MIDPIQIFICGPKRDHKCDSDGPPVVADSDGHVMLESEAKKNPDFHWNTWSVTCSKCGVPAYVEGMWQ